MKENHIAQVEEFSAFLYKKMSAYGLTEILPFICTSAVWGRNPGFSHPELPWGSPQGVTLVWWLLDSRYSSSSWVPLGAHWLSLEDCSHCWLQHACLLTWQEIISLLTRKKEHKEEWEKKEQRREGKLLSTTKWHKCQEVLPATEQWQGHLPSASAAAADDLQPSPKGIQGGVRLCYR